MNDIKEEWKDIKGYEGLYQVSNLGRVKSVERTIIRKNGMKQHLQQKLLAYSIVKGYFRVSLHKDCVKKEFLVHRLVAEAFIPNLDNKPCVGHLKKLPDGTEDRTANEVWNLAWMTYEENNNFGTHNERISNSHKGKITTNKTKEKMRNSSPKKRKVLQCTLDGKVIKEWDSVRDCHRNGYNHGCVSKCCNNCYYTSINVYKGYIWRYKEKGVA